MGDDAFVVDISQVPASRAEENAEHGQLTPLPKDRPTPRFVEDAVSVPAVSGSDPVFAVLCSALDGLSLRQRVIADNIANVDTPGFRATSVDFESSLRDAIESGGRDAVHAEMMAEDTPVGPNGNNVDLRKEMLAATQSQFAYQLMTRAVSDRFSLIKTVAN